MTPTPFWPTSLGEWVTIAVVVAAAAGAIWRWVKLPILKEVNSVGERLNVHIIEAKVLDAKFEARADALERTSDLAHLDFANLREAVGRLGAQVATLADVTQAGALIREKELGVINATLERIETKVNERTARGA